MVSTHFYDISNLPCYPLYCVSVVANSINIILKPFFDSSDNFLIQSLIDEINRYTQHPNLLNDVNRLDLYLNKCSTLSHLTLLKETIIQLAQLINVKSLYVTDCNDFRFVDVLLREFKTLETLYLYCGVVDEVFEIPDHILHFHCISVQMNDDRDYVEICDNSLMESFHFRALDDKVLTRFWKRIKKLPLEHLFIESNYDVDILLQLIEPFPSLKQINLTFKQPQEIHHSTPIKFNPNLSYFTLRKVFIHDLNFVSNVLSTLPNNNNNNRPVSLDLTGCKFMNQDTENDFLYFLKTTKLSSIHLPQLNWGINSGKIKEAIEDIKSWFLFLMPTEHTNNTEFLFTNNFFESLSFDQNFTLIGMRVNHQEIQSFQKISARNSLMFQRKSSSLQSLCIRKIRENPEKFNTDICMLPVHLKELFIDNKS